MDVAEEGDIGVGGESAGAGEVLWVGDGVSGAVAGVDDDGGVEVGLVSDCFDDGIPGGAVTGGILVKGDDKVRDSCRRGNKKGG